MAERQLVRFRTYLILWSGFVLANFIYVQTVTRWGATIPDFNPRDVWDPIYYGVYYSTAVLIPYLAFQIPIARRYGGWTSSIGRALITFGLGVLLWGFGNFYWFLKNVGGDDAPYPSLADVGYLAVLPLAGWALWELSKVVGVTKRDWRWLPLALLVAFPLNAWLMFPASLLPFGLSGPEAGTFDTTTAAIISTTYVLSDVTLMAMAAIVAIGARRAAGGRFFTPVLAYTLSIVLLYIGDLFFNYRIAKETFYNGDFSDGLYSAFIISSSWAAYLFLLAEVRATRAAHEADRAWSPRTQGAADGDEDDEHAVPPLESIPTAILAAQERVLGPQVAQGVFRSTDGIELDEANGSARAIDTIAIDALVREFRAKSGPLGEMACWTAVRGILERHPDIHLASLERFRPPSQPQAASASSTAASST